KNNTGYRETIAECFAYKKYVRRQTQLRTIKCRPRSVKTGKHFIENHQDLVTGADMAKLAVKFIRGLMTSTDSLHGLDEDCCDVVVEKCGLHIGKYFRFAVERIQVG